MVTVHFQLAPTTDKAKTAARLGGDTAVRAPPSLPLQHSPRGGGGLPAKSKGARAINWVELTVSGCPSLRRVILSRCQVRVLGDWTLLINPEGLPWPGDEAFEERPNPDEGDRAELGACSDRQSSDGMLDARDARLTLVESQRCVGRWVLRAGGPMMGSP